jgi:hypothetical protein
VKIIIENEEMAAKQWNWPENNDGEESGNKMKWKAASASANGEINEIIGGGGSVI